MSIFLYFFLLLKRGSLNPTSSLAQEVNTVCDASPSNEVVSAEVTLSNKETSFTEPSSDTANIKRKGKVETV